MRILQFPPVTKIQLISSHANPPDFHNVEAWLTGYSLSTLRLKYDCLTSRQIVPRETETRYTNYIYRADNELFWYQNCLRRI